MTTHEDGAFVAALAADDIRTLMAKLLGGPDGYPSDAAAEAAFRRLYDLLPPLEVPACSLDGCTVDGPHYHRDTLDGEEVVRLPTIPSGGSDG